MWTPKGMDTDDRPLQTFAFLRPFPFRPPSFTERAAYSGGYSGAIRFHSPPVAHQQRLAILVIGSISPRDG